MEVRHLRTERVRHKQLRGRVKKFENVWGFQVLLKGKDQGWIGGGNVRGICQLSWE